MKKLISMLLILMLCLMTANVFAADASQKDYPQRFWDVPKDHWAFTYIAELVNKGVLAGYEDGSFRPDNTVTRAEWAKIMVLAAGLPANDNNVYYTDMSNHWANIYVNTAKDYLAAYTDGTFRPDQAAVREDVTVSMVKLKGYDVSNVDYSYLSQFTDTNSISNSLKAYVAVAVEKDLISGFDDGTFRGQDTLTRAEAATLLWRAFQYGNDNKVVDAPAETPAPSATAPIQTPTPTDQPTESPKPTPDLSEEPAETMKPTETPEPAPEQEPIPKPYELSTVVYAKDVTSIIQDRNGVIYFIDGDTVYSYQDGNQGTVTTAADLLAKAPAAEIEIDGGAYGTILPEDLPDECHLLSLIYDYENQLPFLFVSYNYGKYAGLFEAYLLTDMSKPYIRSDEILTPFYNVGVSEPTSCTIENNAIYYKNYSSIDRFDLQTGVSSDWKGDEWGYISTNMFKIGDTVFSDHGADNFATFVGFEIKSESQWVEAVKYAVTDGELYFLDSNLNFYKVTNLEHSRAEIVFLMDDVDIADGKTFTSPGRMEKAEMFYNGDGTVLFFDRNNKSIRQISKR